MKTAVRLPLRQVTRGYEFSLHNNATKHGEAGLGRLRSREIKPLSLNNLTTKCFHQHFCDFGVFLNPWLRQIMNMRVIFLLKSCLP